MTLKKQPIHERLDLYVVARQLAIDLYRDTARFSPGERYGLVSQIRRAAVSIPANVAEGAARRSKREFGRFLLAARGSATELRLLLDIACQTGSLTQERFDLLGRTLDRIIAMSSGLIQRADRLSSLPRGSA
ncbi:MAG TPA: four helix bundle protein [Thermoanaerobaculia bacterium]|nr:four helix bundle protein [Thermoanaerobaculia bacterium]